MTRAGSPTATTWSTAKPRKGERAAVAGCVAVIAPFIDVAWLEIHRDEVVLADVRWYMDGRSGRAGFEGGHLPGAVFVDLDTALTAHLDPAIGGRHPLPEPDDFAAAMAALGIGDDDTVIAYDDAGGVIAGRLIWMLRATGHEAALLDGGVGAWRRELASGPGARRSELGDTDRDPAQFAAREWPSERIVDIDEVAAISADPASTALLIDARQRERFEGEPDEVDPQAGHIPGAYSVSCRENLDADGRLLPLADLRARFEFPAATEVISYCGSGVTACHNLLAMEQVGLGPGRLFPGSWSQWSRDPDRSVQTGVEPTRPTG
ncbi:MAG: sulfurtransferase [Actinobacteria bacterium]|nr:sulfurtransferase [Actinomycetota bacterium]